MQDFFTPIFTNQFRRDMERMRKHGKNIAKLKAVIELLRTQELLPEKYKNHKLVGNFAKQRECHIQSA